ncbi:MAG: hypothetical protein ACE5EJ_05925 [Nitrosopumilaceae archaeon]
MSQIETEYDEFVNKFGKTLEKVDLSLALQTMNFQKKFTDTKPKVDLRVCYRDGTDLEAKRIELDNLFACLSTTYVKRQFGVPECKNTLRVECLADLETIHKISQDPDVISINGSASIASY